MCKERNLNSDKLADRLFDTFDSSDDGEVVFRELVVTLSQLTRGTLSDLTKVFFEMYDMDNDDGVNVAEVSELRAVPRLRSTSDVRFHIRRSRALAECSVGPNHSW